MGYMRNHAIVVSSWQAEGIEAAHAAAKAIFGKEREPFGATFDRLVSPIIDGMTNGVRSFFIAPDGSKEGWEPSDDGDACRAEFVAWLRDAETRSLRLEWVEVQFGDDDRVTRIVNHSDDDLDAGADQERGESDG